jgi:hypothetical protein
VKIQELSLPDYPRCILGPESATGNVRSTGKPHLTDILRDMARTAGIGKEDSSFSEDDMDNFAAGGWLWERVFDMAHCDAIERGELVNIGEIELDNIVGTPDRVDFRVPKVIELKCRWKSARSFEHLEREWWIELSQIRAYCHMLQILEADLIVMFIGGMWRPPTPMVLGKNIKFTERELAEQWDAIMRFARDKGYLPATSISLPSALPAPKPASAPAPAPAKPVATVKPAEIITPLHTAPAPAPPVGRPHAKQLGQITGGTQDQNDAEALRLLKMIGSVDWQRDGALQDWLCEIVDKQFDRFRILGVENFSVTGRELFQLRSAKDILVDKGIL